VAATDPLTDRIDRLTTEGAIGLAAAARVFGSFRNGANTSPTTLYRWATRGVRVRDGRRVRLESFRVGGRLMTSRPACLRFLAEQQDPPTDTLLAPLPTRAEAQRRRSVERAVAALEGAGA
jgi:hypothetical protein